MHGFNHDRDIYNVSFLQCFTNGSMIKDLYIPDKVIFIELTIDLL